MNNKERVWYSYQVGWQTGSDCATPKELDAQGPLGKDHKNNCECLMRFAYKLCDNGGLGGFYKVGCAQYSYQGFGSD
jgi:hypothetical protein